MPTTVKRCIITELTLRIELFPLLVDMICLGFLLNGDLSFEIIVHILLWENLAIMVDILFLMILKIAYIFINHVYIFINIH